MADVCRTASILCGARSGTNLRDTLLVHSSVEHCPGYPSRVLALEEEGFGLAILEPEGLAVTTDVEFALFAASVSLRSQSKDLEGVLSTSDVYCGWVE